MIDRQLRIQPADRTGAGPPTARRRYGASRRARHERRIAGPLVRLAILVVLWIAILGGGGIGYFALTLPDTSQLGVAQRRPTITILAEDGTTLANLGDLFGQPLTLSEISPYVPQAVIATEDRRFYRHFGLDPISMLRAAFTDLRAGHVVEGGSTITQQLAKIVFLTPERSLARKIRETLLALWLEHRFTKDQILEIYLNRVYLGAGTYGVDAAAHRYFGKSAAKLSLFESAVVAGLLKAPTRFSPANDRERAVARADQVLNRMVEAGFIRGADATSAEKQGSTLAVPSRPGSRYFADWIADQLREFAAAGDRDLRIRTTLDPRLQAAAEAAIGGVLIQQGRKHEVTQGALIALSPNGAVRAMVGGRDYSQSQFNRATQAQRQPGSAFKPFVYLAGLEAGLRPNDHFVDAPIRIGDWQPHNYTNRYLGEMTLAEALAQSVNTIAVQVAQRAGVSRVIAVANRLGITSDLAKDVSIALGTNAVNLLELVSAYVPFANGGNGVLPYGISEIRDSDGRHLYQRAGSGPGPVIAPELVGIMDDMMAGVIGHGTGKSAALPRPIAGKTGTTQEYRDAWFIGFTADLVAGVWFGNDDNTPMNRVTGGSLPALAWRHFMLAATSGTPIKSLPSAPPAEESPIDKLLSWLSVGSAPPKPLLPEGWYNPALGQRDGGE